MTIVSVKCKHCGNNMNFDTGAKNVTCSFCGSSYMVMELLDQKDISFLEKMKPEEIETKIRANEHIKNGEAFLYKAEYVSAENEFRKAIGLDENNYHGYFGVIKAKTHNFSILPDGYSFEELAKNALKFVDKDDYDYLKNELKKLELLKKEREQQKKQEEERKRIAYSQEKAKQKRSNLWCLLILISVFAITGIALIAVITKNYQDENRNAEQNSTIEISTAAELSHFANKKEYLSATIVLKNDIDFGDGLWSPVGTASAPFTGTFYGNNHTIKNIKFADNDHADENYIGFFGFVKGATIMGLKLENAKISSTEKNNFSEASFVGFIAGRSNDSSIKLCEITNSCEILISGKEKSNLNVGGIVGYAKNSTISNCYCHANITATSSEAQFVRNTDSLDYTIGGIAGKLFNSGLSYCYASSELSMSVSEKADQPNIINLFAGGVAGISDFDNSDKSYINFCYFIGKISASVDAVQKEYKIAAVVAKPANDLRMISNFALFEENSYKFDDTSLQNSELADADLLESLSTSNNDIITLISKYYNSNVWENTDSTLPTIKVKSNQTSEEG